MNYYKILDKRFFTIFFIPLIIGSISVFSFQPYNITWINFLTLPTIFLLLTFITKRSQSVYRKKPYLKNLFFVGYFFGVGFFLTGIYWIANSLTYDESFKYYIPLAIILIPLFLGIFYGIATLVVGPYIKNNFSSILLFCSSFALIDYLRAKILTGFPWNMWAYSWSWFIEVFQILNPIGLFAFNLLSLTLFCAPLLLIFKKNKKNYVLTFLISILFLANYIFGSYLLNSKKETYELDKSQNLSRNIKIIATNFDLKYNLSLQEIEQSLKKLIRYSDPERGQSTIFIWPEGVFTGYNFSEIKKYKDLFKNNFSTEHLIIFGINTQDENSNKFYNSLLVINNDLKILYKYDKKKLVPFGEFLPFESFLNRFGLKKITQGHGTFSQGYKNQNFVDKNLNILPLICYEIIFPELIQKASSKTNLIINISEDAWFGGSIGPKQHFAKAIFRAVESNIYIARAANKGVSAFIDNTGNIIKSLEPNEKGNIELKIPLINNNSKNKNDLIFFILLFTYMIIFFTLRNKL